MLLIAPGHVPAASAAQPEHTERERRHGGQAAREAVAAGPDYAVQPEEQVGGGGAVEGIRQEGQGVELEPG